MYPYVPNGKKLFSVLKDKFETDHPLVNIQLVETFQESGSGLSELLASNYYDGGLLQSQADIYEIDTILLQSMIKANKIDPIQIPNSNYISQALKAVQYKNRNWGIPHWVCGNFLFYKKGDRAIAKASNLDELINTLKKEGFLLLDLKGKSTLGEFYLTSLAASDGNETSILKKIHANSLDPTAVKILEKLLSLCPTGYCRSKALHNRVGFYAQLFAQGKARAYIGYSESLYYVLEEIRNNCSPTDDCLTVQEILVRAIPTLNSNGKQVGWTDVLSLSRNLSPKKKKIAMDFIRFLTSWEAYKLILNSNDISAPRYLLPALIFSNKFPQLQAIHYPMFYDAYQSRLILSGKNLNNTLREKGDILDFILSRSELDQN
jgi:thiamine pyridinylase